MLIDGDEDALGSAIRRNDVSPSLMDNLPSFGDTLKGMNAEAILEWTLRNPDSLGELLQLMRDPSANKSDIQVYLINAKETVDPISQEGDTSDAFEATFRARNFAKDSTVKFTIARSSASDKANLVGLNLEEAFIRFTQNSSQNVLAIKDARTLEVKEDFRGSIKVAVRKNDNGR